MNRVILSPEYFPNPTIGRPISGAQVFVGEVDTDPEVVINQKQISVQQEDSSIVSVSQPVLTGAGGVPLHNGSPVTMLVDGNYALKVLDSTGSQIYYIPSIADFETANQSADDIVGLIGITEHADGDAVNVSAYFTSFPQLEFEGGDFFVWQEDADKAQANGGTVIDPDNTGGFDGTTSTLAAFLTAQGGGIGLGCWVRSFSGVVFPVHFGGEDGAPLLAAIDYAVSSGFPLDLRRSSDTPITINVPTHYAVLQDAFDAVASWQVNADTIIDIKMETGFVPASGISCENGSFSHIRISSVDAEVVVNASFTGRFIECTNGNAPTLNAFIDGNNALDRVYSLFHSTGEITTGNGSRNVTGRAWYANASQLGISGTKWYDFGGQLYATAGSAVQFGNGIIDGATIVTNGSLVASRGGAIEAQGLTMTNCSAGMECKRAGSSINCHEGTFDNIGIFVARSSRGATISMDGATITNVIDAGLEAISGSIISFGEGASITAKAGNTVAGLKASGGGTITAIGSTIADFGLDNLVATQASMVSANGATVSGAGRHNVFSEDGSTIDITAGSATTSGTNDLRISGGSFITAVGCTTTTSPGTPAIADTNVAGFNAILSNRGVIWS